MLVNHVKVLHSVYVFVCFLVLIAHKILRSDELTNTNVSDSQFLPNELRKTKDCAWLWTF